MSTEEAGPGDVQRPSSSDFPCPQFPHFPKREKKFPPGLRSEGMGHGIIQRPLTDIIQRGLLLPLLRESRARLMSQLPLLWDVGEQETQASPQNIRGGWLDSLGPAAVGQQG